MTFKLAAVLGVTAIGLSLALTGCSRGILLHPNESRIPACDNVPAHIPVAALNKQKRVTCSLHGARVDFPDGHSLRVPKLTLAGGYTVESKTERREYYVANLGIYGIVASEKVNHQNWRWWGSPEGVQKVQAGCGRGCK